MNTPERHRYITCCSCFNVEAVSSFLAIALILEAREAPFEVAEGMLPRDTILIESLLLLLSSFCDCCARQSRCFNSQAAKLGYRIRKL